ncbi:DUF402 domain-containing protein [Ornithinibacillus xuwenensis]|uniref:DUF402 domain-containing protein n=1 Tax=Ornithinibacillus xuwenensis TaxID=3144668 RepID=A0ABU9XK51_9BACI
MLKRKYGDRSDWKRITKRKYVQSYLDTTDFKGYITLLHTIKVREPLFVTYGNKQVCIVDDGYFWLQQFPFNKNHSITAMYDANGNIIQWYIDICSEIGIENGIPWMDDLFLDIIVLPTGESLVLDADELEQALNHGTINQTQFEFAWNEANRLTEIIENKEFKLLEMAHVHKEILLGLVGNYEKG